MVYFEYFAALFACSFTAPRMKQVAWPEKPALQPDILVACNEVLLHLNDETLVWRGHTR
jgi:hypothetical protein